MNQFRYALQIDPEMLQYVLGEWVEFHAVCVFKCDPDTLQLMAIRSKFILI